MSRSERTRRTRRTRRNQRAARLVIFGGAGLATVACSLVYPVGNLEGPPLLLADAAAPEEATRSDAGGADGANDDADVVVATAECPQGKGPNAIRVRFDGGSFCIDKTEVTKAEYAAFLIAKGSDMTGQPPECADNKSFVPDASWPIALGEENVPVAYIDWCDARAFCAWASKRLCRQRVDGFVVRDEWYVACSRDGTRAYPYGSSYDPLACAGENHVSEPVDAGSFPKCVGGYDGLFDMSGNVSEWFDACDDAGTCRHKGGGYSSTGGDKLACDTAGGIQRSEVFSSVGIRCCAD